MSELQGEESARNRQEAHPQPGDVFKVQGKVRRRTIVKGAAWSIPVIAVAAAAPVQAASTNCALQSPARIDAQAGGTALTQLPVTIPAGTQYLVFSVVGGDGGASTRTRAFGYGASITGTIPIAALGGASSLQLVAGASGGYGNSFRGAHGGLGYGNGGNGGNGMGFGGGGGSALLLPDGTPLVVAGGGGGGAVLMYTTGLTVADNSATTRGDAGLPSGVAQAGFSSWRAANGGGVLSLAGGGDQATESGPGAGGTITGYSTASTAGMAGVGRDGGNGAGVPPQYITETGVANAGAGGGGGGYLGGGGGATNYWTSGGRTLVAGGGGGGMSFIASSVSTTQARVKTGTDAADGFVQIEFYVCS